MPTITKEAALAVIKTHIKTKNQKNIKHIFYLLDEQVELVFDKFIDLLLSEEEYVPIKYNQLFKVKVPKWRVEYEEDIMEELGLINNNYLYIRITNVQKNYSGEYEAHLYIHDEDHQPKIHPFSVKEKDMLRVEKNEPYYTVFKKNQNLAESKLDEK
tara:strand:+ start:1921 stop:2391 length:471 start_codon:yes stop_codon:yes gene_type:complete